MLEMRINTAAEGVRYWKKKEQLKVQNTQAESKFCPRLSLEPEIRN